MPQPRQDDETMRPAYPPDPEENLYYRTEEDWTAYPDQVYESRMAPRQPLPPQGYPPERSPWAAGGTPRKPRHTALWAFIAMICVVLLGLMGYCIASMYEERAPFRAKVDFVQSPVFAQGVLVDGIHIGGMTRQQAEAALGADHSRGSAGMHITIQVDAYPPWILTANELPFERNLQAILDTAFAIGRQGSTDTIASSTTPFEYRFAHLQHTVSNPVQLYTEETYERADVRRLSAFIEGQINREPVDAQVATFDFYTRTFTFTEDMPGARIDGESLYQQLISALDRKDYNGVIQMQSEPLPPKITKVELMNSFSLISSFTTETTSNANRNNNIDLAARAISGRVVMPGESFSFNEATGQRTTEKGYLPAAAIAGGTTVDEVGGGVCQVSSTLFNAAAMADMTIVTRFPHAWPSHYVDKGRDATVNWPNLDFVFRNDSATPIFIVSFYERRQVTVEIYGARLGPGVTIELATRLLSTTEPPLEPLYQNNPQLPPGTVQEKKKARTGYEVDTYKIYLRNGVETRRELLCSSSYRMIQQVLEYN